MAENAATIDPLVADLLRACGGEHPPRRIWIAFSGGHDSSTLLHAMAAARAAGLTAPLCAVYVDHGLQPDSGAWRDHCHHACEALDIACRTLEVTVRADTGESLEACARKARYGALGPLLGDHDVLLTAHHRDDQAETLLQQLLRGAGVAGLAAMPVRAPFGSGHLLRPWLTRGRDELAAYAERHGLCWVDDPSNVDSAFDRNYLRHDVLPVLEARWPAAKRVLARSAAHCAEAAQLLEAVGDEDLAALGEGACPETLPIAALRRLVPARQRNLLRHWLRLRALPVPTTAQMVRLSADVLAAASDRNPCVAWGGVEARRYRDRLYVLRLTAGVTEFAPLSWDPRYPLAVGAGVLQAAAAEGQGLAQARLARSRVEVRCRRGGETLRPSGQQHHRSLKHLYQERGVPTWVRARTPLIYVDGQLAAVAGQWLDADFAAGPGEPGWVVRWTDGADVGMVDSFEAPA